jgi:HTH-type transcriptional regulator / antitoxin HipB
MKDIAEINAPEVIQITIDKSLNRLNGKVHDSKKMRKANEMLARMGVPTELFEDDIQVKNPIGTLIKQARLQRNLSQEALSALLGVDKSLISKLENNDYSVSMATILQVFKVLNAELSFVVKLQH